MTEQNPFIHVLEKDIEWSSLVGVPMPVQDVKVYQRMEKLEDTLLDKGVLRIRAVIKLFAVVPAGQEQRELNPAVVYTGTTEIHSHVGLHTETSRNDIISIEHHVTIKNHVSRPDKIIVNGTLKLVVSYTARQVLEGTVTEFPSGAPVKGATINVRRLDDNEPISSTTTAGNGKYHIKDLPPGIYLIEAHSGTHKPDGKISVVKNRDIVDFVLHR